MLLETGGRQGRYEAVRTKRYLYVEYLGGERELYDLRADPGELQNRARDPAMAAVRADLARRLHRLQSCAGASCR